MSDRSSARSKQVRRLLARADQGALLGHLRNSDRREQVVEAILDIGKHFSLEELHEHLPKGLARAGFSTVYRTVRLLVEAGVLVERHFGGSVARFEFVEDEGKHHDHLICVRCGLILEFEEPAIEALQEQVAKRHGYALRAHTHELYGLCETCTAKAKERGQ